MSNREGFHERMGASSLADLEIWLQRAVSLIQDWFSDKHRVTRRVMVSTILILALLAFELFNFDTTEYALEDLLGPTSFAGLRWATILAIAFCSIDFAGLARLIMPDDDAGARTDSRMIKPTWLLLGAWLIGGGVNATMTWWAVSLALMGHDLGNELLSRQQLLRGVPIFVAMLVWMTRILIISSFSVTGEGARLPSRRRTVASRPGRRAPLRTFSQRLALSASGRGPAEPEFVGTGEPTVDRRAPVSPRRPKMPRPPRGTRPAAAPMRAKGKGQ